MSGVIDLTVESSPESDSARLPWLRQRSARSPARSRARGYQASDAIEVGDSDSDSSDSDSDLDSDAVRIAGPSQHRQVRPMIRPRDFRANLADIDAALMRHEVEVNRLNAQEAAGYQAVANPQPEEQQPAARRIRLGGAVYRDANREVRFTPGRSTQHLRVHRGQTTLDAPPQSPRAPSARLRSFAGFLGMNGAVPQDDVGGPGPRTFVALVPHLQHVPHGMAAQLLGHVAANDVPTIVSKVTAPTFPPPRPGFTSTWDVDELDNQGPIELDARGRKVKPKGKPYLACSNCPEPLRVSSAARDEADRIWALRCGHLLDERCLISLSSGSIPDSALDPEPSPKKRKTARRSKPKKAVLPTHTWDCPSCNRQHASEYVDGSWKQTYGLGATQLFI